MINMFAKILNYLRKDPYLWIAALPVAFFMLIVWLPYTINDSFGTSHSLKIFVLCLISSLV